MLNPLLPLSNAQHDALDRLAERNPDSKVVGMSYHFGSGKVETYLGSLTAAKREKCRLAPRCEPIIRYPSGQHRRLTHAGKFTTVTLGGD